MSKKKRKRAKTSGEFSENDGIAYESISEFKEKSRKPKPSKKRRQKYVREENDPVREYESFIEPSGREFKEQPEFADDKRTVEEISRKDVPEEKSEESPKVKSKADPKAKPKADPRVNPEFKTKPDIKSEVTIEVNPEVHPEFKPEVVLEDISATPKIQNKKLDKLEHKAQKAEYRTEKTRNRLPQQKQYRLVRTFDEESGETIFKLETIRRPKGPKKDTLKKKMAKKFCSEADIFVHQKIAENEKENSAVEAAHKTEQAGEYAVEYAWHNRPDKNVRLKRKISRLQKKQFRAETAFRMEKYLEENPEVRKKFYQKFMQKQRIKHEYAKAMRKGNTARESAEYAQKATEKSTVIARKLMEFAREHIAAVVSMGTFGMFFLIIATFISSCGALLGGGSSTIIAGAYQSLPGDIDSAEDSMKEKEMYLRNDIDSIESDYPGYDEYEYDIGHIGHDPFTLINYLSAAFITFTASGAESTIQTLFDEMYTLSLTPRVETRTREVTITIPGDMPGEESFETEEEEYTVTILNVTLSVKPLEDIVVEKLAGNDEAMQLYAGYSVSHGLLQQFYSPVSLDWMSRISCYYGYRVHPISGENQFHRGLDIAILEGTELKAAMSGTVMTATYDDSYGYYVIIKDANGYETRYAHMQSLSVTPGQTITHGELIGYSGNTGGSTGPHLHLECLVNGEYYNPIFYFANGV